MEAAFVFCEKKLTVYLQGELDHHAAGGVRGKIDGEILRRSPLVVALDFSKVTFMDSSGLGLIMGRYKLMSERGGEVVVENPPPHINKVLALAGINRLVKVKRSEKLSKGGKKRKENSCDEKETGQGNKQGEDMLSGAVTE